RPGRRLKISGSMTLFTSPGVRGCSISSRTPPATTTVRLPGSGKLAEARDKAVSLRAGTIECVRLVVAPLELSDGAVAVEVDVSGTEEHAGVAVDGDVLAVVASGCGQNAG